jgi:hypothetical protein
MAVITKELADNIAKKLKAKVQKQGKKHDIFTVYHEGKMVAHFGIRRGARKDLGHDYIPNQIFLRPRDARLLGQCPLSREDWVNILKEKGKL